MICKNMISCINKTNRFFVKIGIFSGVVKKALLFSLLAVDYTVLS